MKKFILIFLLLISSGLVHSQDYQCIRDGAEYYYTDSILFHAIRIDSVVPEGDNLMYYNYSTMAENDTDQYCYTRFGPSWIGKKVTVKPDGKNVFYNRLDSTITIETQKNVGEVWTCYNFSNGNYILATIAEIQEMEFLTLTDSVKKITFQAYNSSGTPITHAINDKYLLLSKTFGLIRTINFKLFPDLYESLFYDEPCSEFILYGISDPPVGKQNLNAVQVYNFDVGDELHTYYCYASSPPDYHKYGYFKRLFLQKEFSANFDSVIFTHYRCGYFKEEIPYIGTVYTYVKDTITGVYFIGNDSIISVLPDEVIIHQVLPDLWEYSCLTSEFFGTTGKQVKAEWRGFYSETPHDCIFVMESKEGKEFGTDKKYYVEGLGYYFDFFQA